MLTWGIEFTGLYRPLPKEDLKGTYLVRDFPTTSFSKSMGDLTCTNCPWSDDRLPTGYLLLDFQLIWSNFAVISRNSRKSWKKLETSNRSNPVRVLTRTKCSCSDDRLSMGYLLPDFQLIWSNFWIHCSFSRNCDPISNRCKPIWVLTQIWSSCNDDRLPIGYSLPSLQQIWKNFQEFREF